MKQVKGINHGGLALMRRAGETLALDNTKTGERILLSVAEVRGGKVILLCAAPDHVKVLRVEVLQPKETA